MPLVDKPLRIESRNPKVRIKFRNGRLLLDKTQKKMADELCMKESYIRHVENGHVNPSLKKMLAFEKYLGIPAPELFPDRYKISQESVYM